MKTATDMKKISIRRTGGIRLTTAACHLGLDVAAEGVETIETTCPPDLPVSPNTC